MSVLLRFIAINFMELFSFFIIAFPKYTLSAISMLSIIPSDNLDLFIFICNNCFDLAGILYLVSMLINGILESPTSKQLFSQFIFALISVNNFTPISAS